MDFDLSEEQRAIQDPARAFAPLRRRVMRPPKYLQNVLIGSTALLFAGAHLVPDQKASGPVLNSAVSLVTQPAPTSSVSAASPTGSIAAVTKAAVAAFAGALRPLSRPEALEKAFQSYFAFKTSHPGEVRKPFLYFVDYGLPSTTPRGYLFNMDSLKVVDGPFTVAHGRGSSTSQYGGGRHLRGGRQHCSAMVVPSMPSRRNGSNQTVPNLETQSPIRA